MYQVTLCTGCLIEVCYRVQIQLPLPHQLAGPKPWESVGAHGGHYWNDIPMLYSDLRHPRYTQMNGDNVRGKKENVLCTRCHYFHLYSFFNLKLSLSLTATRTIVYKFSGIFPLMLFKKKKKRVGCPPWFSEWCLSSEWFGDIPDAHCLHYNRNKIFSRPDLGILLK